MTVEVPPLEESSCTLRVKGSRYQEEPRIPDINRNNEILQLYNPLRHLAEDTDCEKLKETKEAVKAKTTW